MTRARLVQTPFLLAIWASLSGAGVPGTLPAAAPAAPTFAKDVAPILYKSCVSCHRPHQIGPMSLLSYAETRPWARSIRIKVLAGEMPPWGADPRYGAFKNDPHLAKDEIDTIVRWVDSGAPMGAASDLPEEPAFKDATWLTGPPDIVMAIPEQQLPAEGELEPRSFVFPNPVKQDLWIQGNQILPGNPAVVHHVSPRVVRLPDGVVVRADQKAYWPDGRLLRRAEFLVYAAVGDASPDADTAKLGAYLPGRGREQYPEGTGRRFPKDAYIEVNVHYQPSGKPEIDSTRLGIYLVRGPVRREIRDGGGVDGAGFREVGGRPIPGGRIPNIPPYAPNFEVSGRMRFVRPATLYALSPHMHLRGKDMTFIAVYPDGREEVLLSVPKFAFNWQMVYEFQTPLTLPAGTQLRAIAHYDNSAGNRYNPAPDHEVYWSEQSWDEMFSPEMRFTYDDVDLTSLVRP